VIFVNFGEVEFESLRFSKKNAIIRQFSENLSENGVFLFDIQFMYY